MAQNFELASFGQIVSVNTSTTDVTTNADIIISAGKGINANGSYGTSGQFLTSNASSIYWSTLSVTGQTIASGTTTVFQQTAAPTGFTKVTTYNDYAMRIVSGSVVNKTNGVAFSTAFASQSVAGTVGGTTLSTANLPAATVSISDPGHVHTTYTKITGASLGVGGTSYVGDSNGGSSTSLNTGSKTTGISASVAGSGTSHNHSFTGTAINLAVNYVDFILATAD